MTTPDPPTGVAAPKTLAAIVFTDVVGFSRHTNVDEQRALASFQRDLAIIKQVCDRHHGLILKTLGDGTLIRFNSADNALSCAIEIQRVIYEQALRLDHRDVLAHRIGVHLGDIVVSAGDVFGDGVNVAARLQREAKPGGIVISRTVYDVVKGKVKFQANCLGPRQLKGIREPMTLWEIPSQHQQLVDRRAEALDGMLPDEVRNPSNTGLKGAPAIIISAVCVILVIIATVLVVNGMQTAKKQHDIDWAKKENERRQKQQQQNANKVVSLNPDPLADAQAVAQLKTMFADNRFDDMAQYVTQTFGTASKAADLSNKLSGLAGYMNWLNVQLDKSSDSAPIALDQDPELSPSGPSRYFVDPNKRLVRATDTGQEFVDLNKLKKETIIALGQAAELLPGATDEVAKNDIEKNIETLRDFSAQFGS